MTKKGWMDYMENDMCKKVIKVTKVKVNSDMTADGGIKENRYCANFTLVEKCREMIIRMNIKHMKVKNSFVFRIF